MTVYVDDAQIPWRRYIMSHMTADTIWELHEFAEKLGLKREWFQNKSVPHYDVSEGVRQKALKMGAELEQIWDGDRKDILERHHRLRKQPRVFNKHRKIISPNAVLVDRTTPFGNPFRGGDAVQEYNRWVHRPEQAELRGLIRRTLKGCDLLCWCAPQPCHADIILRIANEEL